MGIRVFEQHEVFTIKEAFNHGHFTVKKTSHVFSVMGISQSHEQNKNRPVKVDGRTFGIMDNESALLEWGLSGPYVAELSVSLQMPVPQTIMKIQNHSKRSFA